MTTAVNILNMHKAKKDGQCICRSSRMVVVIGLLNQFIYELRILRMDGWLQAYSN